MSECWREMEEEDDYEEYVPVAKRRAMEAQKILRRRQGNSSAVDDESEKPEEEEAKPSLLVKATQLRRDAPEVTQTEQIVQQEKEMIEHLSDRKTLMSVRELAKGITYSDPLPTGWKPPLPIRRMSRRQCDAVRRQWHIIVDGDQVPPPIKTFKEMRYVLTEFYLRQFIFTLESEITRKMFIDKRDQIDSC